MKKLISLPLILMVAICNCCFSQNLMLEMSLIKGLTTIAGVQYNQAKVTIPLPASGEVVMGPASKAIVRQKGKSTYVTLEAGKKYSINKIQQFIKSNGTNTAAKYMDMLFYQPLNTETTGSGAAGPSRGGEESMPYSPSENAMLLGDTIRLQWSNSGMIKPSKILVIGISDTVYAGDATNGQLAIHIEKPGTYQWRLESRKGLEVYSSSFIKLNADDAGKWRDRMAVFIKESGTKDPDIQNLIKQAFLEENHLVE